jgi:transcriptional regulator with PAS, ATPase and Fis domain
MVQPIEEILEKMGFSNDVFRILEHLYSGIMVTLKDSTIIFANHSFSRLLGVPSERLLGRKLSEIEPNALALKALKQKREYLHVTEYVANLKQRIFSSVFLLPSTEAYVGSFSIFTKLHPELMDEKDDGHARYIESFIEERLSQGTALPAHFSEIIGEDPKFKQALFKAYKAGKANFPVLVVGESGTGKELVVRAIHKTSRRSAQEFVALNCAALPSNLVESELFGYEPGSFTDARRDGKKGLFLLADKGTLFFDEVGDFELSTQAKILRALEEKVFRRVGGNRDIRVDTRIISATNKDLEGMIMLGKFREDLYYRINTMRIHLPPLRERGRDLFLLAEHFLEQLGQQYKKNPRLSEKSLEILMGYDWPGNVRELRAVIDYAINMTETDVITPKDLPPYLTLSSAKSSLSQKLPTPRDKDAREVNDDSSPFKSIMNAFEKDLLETALKKTRNRTGAMKLLGLSRRAFYLKLNKHGLV